MKDKTDIEQYINANGLEAGSNTPDWILAEFVGDVAECMPLEKLIAIFDKAVNARANWYGRHDEPAQLVSEKALGVAARVWCDQDMEHIKTDPDAAQQIAKIVQRVWDEAEGRLPGVVE